VISDVNVPIEVAVCLCAAFCAFGVWAGRLRARCQLDRHHNPLGGLMQSAALDGAIDLAARRNAARGASQAVLHGRIDQLAGLRGVWHPEIREQVRSHVATVMRAGLRRGDRFTPVGGEGFTIVIPGADERTAARIADRLRRALSQLRLPNLGAEHRVTASFGVAADRRCDTGDLLDLRARRALQAAIKQGQDHVIAASEIDEVRYLPAPDTQPIASAA